MAAILSWTLFVICFGVGVLFVVASLNAGGDDWVPGLVGLVLGWLGAISFITALAQHGLLPVKP